MNQTKGKYQFYWWTKFTNVNETYFEKCFQKLKGAIYKKIFCFTTFSDY